MLEGVHDRSIARGRHSLDHETKNTRVEVPAEKRKDMHSTRVNQLQALDCVGGAVGVRLQSVGQIETSSAEAQIEATEFQNLSLEQTLFPSEPAAADSSRTFE
jgi:hypothetical protein